MSVRITPQLSMGCLALLTLALWVGLSACASAGSATESPSQFKDLSGDLSVENLERFVQAAGEPAAPLTMSLPEARASLPFAFGLPTWMPEGFAQQETVEVVLPPDPSGYATVIVTWQNAGEEAFTLQASSAASDPPQFAGAGSTEQVSVNGQPATLVRGSKLGRERLSLSWDLNGVAYTLAADESAVAVEELVRMAEAIR